MATIAVHVPDPTRVGWWVDHLGSLLPGFRIVPASQVEDPAGVHYAVVWKPPHGLLASFPALRATISIGAGIDHVVADPHYPPGVPILKTIGPDMTQRMREYIALHVLRFHRELPTLQAAADRRQWKQILTPVASQRPVGVLGMGHLGAAAAETLRDLGFDVAGWSRSGQAPQGITGFDGPALPAFLARTQILVCLLPLTPLTENILNADTFAALPAGACLINAARGAHLDESALLDALASGQVAGATLDVFRTEPLPDDNPLWDHPNVLVTPHLASLIDPVSGGRVIADHILQLERAGAH